MDVDNGFWLIFFLSLRDMSISTVCLNLGKFNSVIVGRMLLSLLRVISMANSESLFDFVLTEKFFIAWMKHFSIEHGFYFFLLLLHVK